jgi:polyisoprenoid-binding protein YceI
MNKLGIGILSFSLFLAACENPADNKPKAKVNEPNTATNSSSNTATAPVRQTKGEAIAFNNENSKVGFIGSKVTGKHDGGFNKFTGTIDLVNNKAEESQVSVDIEMASVFSDADGLTKHLMDSDFFEVAKHPKSSFTSTKIEADKAKGEGNYTVTGDLEMRGVKKSISFPAKIGVSPAEVTVDTEFAINRKDFGIVYAGKADDLIRDDVVIKLNLKAPRKK